MAITSPQGQRFDAGRVGTKYVTVGKDATSFMFDDIQKAVDFAQNNSIIEIEAGTYTLTAALSITKPLYIIGKGDVVITHALAVDLVDVNVPVTIGAATVNTFKNITFTHTGAAGGDTINIDNNGGGAVDMTVNIVDCSVAVTGTGYAINVVQTTTSKDIVLNVCGTPALHTVGVCYWAGAKALSAATFYGLYLNGATNAIVVPAGNAVASTLNVFNCLVIGAAVTTGGNVANITNYGGNVKATAGFKAALALTAAGDFDALGTESPMGFAAI